MILFLLVKVSLLLLYHIIPKLATYQQAARFLLFCEHQNHLFLFLKPPFDWLNREILHFSWGNCQFPLLNPPLCVPVARWAMRRPKETGDPRWCAPYCVPLDVPWPWWNSPQKRADQPIRELFLLVLNAGNSQEWSQSSLVMSSSQPPETHPATLRLGPVRIYLRISVLAFVF